MRQQNREFKFRAWWHPTQLEYRKGVIINPPKMLQIGDDSGTKTGLDCCVYANQGQNVILMQYTGLHDKNGKEIYEGDIVNHETYGIGEVVYKDDGFFVKNGQGNQWFDVYEEVQQRLSWNGSCKIIGNIYENADLLVGVAK